MCCPNCGWFFTVLKCRNEYTNEWAQKVDKKNGVTCLVSIVYSQSYSHENGTFFVFSADGSYWKILSATERSCWVLSENVTVNRLWRLEIFLKKLLSKQKHGWRLANGSSEPNNPLHFLKDLSKTFQICLNILQRLTDFLLSSKN